MNRIITISREFGSGGRTIGKEAAARLGIKCYDSDLIIQIAQRSGFSPVYLKENMEGDSGTTWWENALAGRNFYMRSNQDLIWEVQRETILDLAQKESCVFVGRCADYILKDSADLLTVFIHASEEKRAERIVQTYGESERDIKKRIADKDKRRKAYHRFYTDTEWGRAKYYDLCLDSGTLGIEKCVDIITQLY